MCKLKIHKRIYSQYSNRTAQLILRNSNITWKHILIHKTCLPPSIKLLSPDFHFPVNNISLLIPYKFSSNIQKSVHYISIHISQLLKVEKGFSESYPESPLKICIEWHFQRIPYSSDITSEAGRVAFIRDHSLSSNLIIFINHEKPLFVVDSR